MIICTFCYNSPRLSINFPWENKDEETETGTYFITESTFKTIPNASAEDIVNDDQAEIEEGNWRISDDGKSLTLTTEYEDGTALTYICTKNK